MFKQSLIAFVALVVGFLIGCAAGVHVVRSAEAKNAVATDLPSLRSEPGKYAGKLVRLTGKLDQCSGWECSLCSEAMTTATARTNWKQCLPLEFRPLMPGTGFGEREQEGIFRFASVTLVARFDPSCWQGGCLDRQVVLFDANVISVQKRRSSSDGLWLGSLTSLQEAPPPLSSAIRGEALKAGFPPEPETKVFTVAGKHDEAVVCWTTVGTASWPSSLEGALDAMSTYDFYHCNGVRKVADRWVVQVQQ